MNDQITFGFSLTLLDWIVGVAAVVGSILFGGFMARRVHAGANSSNFFLAGRKLPWWIVGFSLYATNIGAEHLVGLTGDAYRYGLCAGTVELTTAMCLGFAAAMLFPYYIKNRVFTIPEFFEMRYNMTARLFFSGLMIVMCVMTKMAFCLYAGALVIHSILGLDVMTTVWVLGIITAIFTMVGGLAGVAYADMIQSVIMILGCTLMLFIGLYEVGGWGTLIAKVPAAMHVHKPYTDTVYPFWGVIMGAIYGGLFYWGVDQVNVQRVLGAKNLREARWGAMFCVLLKFTPIFIFALPGVIAYALFPGREPKTVFVTLMNELLPSGMRGLVLAALVCALISSLDATMNSVSTLTVRDFLMRVRPHAGERAQVRIGRLAILISMIFGVAGAWLVYKTPEGLYKYLQTISIYLIMPIAPAIIFGIMSKRVNMTGAVASVAVGTILAGIYVTDQLMGVEAGSRAFPFLHHTMTLNYTYRGLWGTILITSVLYGVSWVGKPTAPEKLATTTIDWSRKLEPFEGLLDWRIQLACMGLMTIVLYWLVW